MKKLEFLSVACLLLLIGLLGSCVSLEDRTMTPQERAEAEIVGSVTAGFTTLQFFHIPNNSAIRNKAYAELKKEAQKKFPGNIDVMNIAVSGSFSGWNIPWIFAVYGPLWANIQKITATGDVVQYNTASRQAPVTQKDAGESSPSSRVQGATTGLEGATNRACETLIYELPKRTTVAVLSVSSRDRNAAAFVMDEIEFQLVDSKEFVMVDRKTLDSVRSEQDFQTSGEVSDASAVSIGNMLGANIVITGTISGSGDTQRLTIKALDVKTAKIVTMAREQF
jgi:TolB-like protein